MNKNLLFLLFTLNSLVYAQEFPVLKGPYLGQTPPGKTAQLFAPKIISTELHDDASPAFNADGTEVYFRIVYKKAGRYHGTIFFMKEDEGGWTVPEVAPFATNSLFGGITFSPDGNRLYTAVNTGEDGAFNMDLAYVERTGETWSEPVIVNELSSPNDELSFLETFGGRVYWTVETKDNPTEPHHYTAKYDSDSYTDIKRITSFPKTAIVDFYAKDGSYVVFSADEGGRNRDLFVCFKNQTGDWAEPINIGPNVNSPWMEKCASITPDGKYLFFVSSREGQNTQPKKLWDSELFTDLENIWRVDVYWVSTTIIDDLKKEHIKEANDTPVVMNPFFGLKPDDTPQLLAPDFITSSASEYNGTFSTDGKAFYYTTVFPEYNFITFTEMLADNTWSEPQVASFSGEYSDYDPLFSLDGSKLYFSSKRPLRGNKQSQIWYVERSKGQWSEPQHVILSDSNDNEFYSSVTHDGTIYFNKWSTGNIYKAQKSDMTYKVEKLPDIINAGFRKGDPYISPNEDYLIFSGYRDDSYGKGDLYISFNINHQWTKPENLGEPINSSALDICPCVTSDGKIFIFSSNRRVEKYGKLNIYYMSSGFIEDLHKKHVE